MYYFHSFHSNVSTLSNLLENCRQKLWMYVSLEDVEVSKAKEEQLKKMVKENREIEEDINSLRMISEDGFLSDEKKI